MSAYGTMDDMCAETVEDTLLPNTNLTAEELIKARRHKKTVQVFTPPEIIDFINKSIDHVLKTEFGQEEGINSAQVNIIDPFAGHANFTTRGIDTGTITPETAGRITHMEIIPEDAAIAKNELKKRGVKNPIVHNVDTFKIDPHSGDKMEAYVSS